MSRERDDRKRNARALHQRLLRAVAETYNAEGQRIWWAAYKAADKSKREQMTWLALAAAEGMVAT